MTKKHHYAQEAGIAAPAKKPRSQTLTPRQHRALVALMERGAVPCKELGILAGQNNFAELCAGLRRKLGADAIATGSFDSLDRDGKPCKPGYYALSPQGRARAVTLLGLAHVLEVLP